MIEEAKRVAEETGSKELIGPVLFGFGEIYRLLKKFEAGEQEYRKALEIYQEVRVDSYWETKVELARLYIDSGRHADAVKLLNEAKAFFTKTGSARMLKKIEEEFARIDKKKSERATT